MKIISNCLYIQVACGMAHTIAMTADDVWSWGNNFKGQLGSGDKTQRLVPTPVGLSRLGAKPAFIATGNNTSFFVSVDPGDVWAWGVGKHLGFHETHDRVVPTQLGLENFGQSRVVMVAAADAHNAAVTEQGSLFVWGSGRICQLGLGRLGLGPVLRSGLGPVLQDHTSDRLVPTEVRPDVFDGSKVMMAACGGAQTLVVTQNGSLYWMGGTFGQQSYGPGCRLESLRPVPMLVGAEHFGGKKVVAASCSSHLIATTEDGAFYTWGEAWDGDWDTSDSDQSDVVEVLTGLGHADREHKVVPTRVAPHLLQGASVGRCRRHVLPESHALAFAMGTHARLGSASALAQSAGIRRSNRLQGKTQGCVYVELPADLVHRIVTACVSVSWPKGPAGELEGLVRLLGGGMIRAQLD
jgi:alpha-tubulin suppressor-like RCC1 family protein